MSAHSAHTFANARKVALPRDLATAFKSDLDLRETLAAKPRRQLGNSLRDCLFVAAGWIMLLGLIQYPVAQLIGIAICSIALLVSKKKDAEPARVMLTRTKALSYRIGRD